MKKALSHIYNRGFSLVEILVAISVFLVFVLATTGVITTTSQNARHTTNSERATFLAEEAIEATRNLRDSADAFQNLPDGAHGLSTSGDEWSLSGSSDTQDIFTREVIISTINGSQKKVTATVSWSDQVSQTNSISINTYLTDWQAPLNGLTITKTIIGTQQSFLPNDLTTNSYDYSTDPPTPITIDIPITFGPLGMTLVPGTYTFTTSNNPNYSLELSPDCGGGSITLDGSSKLCDIVYSEYVAPTVSTPTQTDITQATVTLGATVTSLGNPASISARGVCYNTAGSPTITNGATCVTATLSQTAPEAYTVNITGLTSGTTYKFVGYATNSTGTGYSAEGTFITTSDNTAPTVTTTAISAITKTTASSGGNVTSDGGAAVTARGVVWNTSPNPTIALPTKTSDGTGTGSFTSSITGLTCNTLYYVRAYATNVTGTAYGSESSFRTSGCVTYVNSASAGANTITIPVHQVGDLLVMFAFRDGSNTAPSLPTGWTNVGTAGGANLASSRVAYRIATATNDPSGTWTNATGLVVHVYRGQNTLTPIGSNVVLGGSGVAVTYPALIVSQTNGSSWVTGFSGHRSTNTNLQIPPTGMTNRINFANATNEVSGHDTNGGVSLWNSTSVNVGGTSSGWRSYSLEIISQ